MTTQLTDEERKTLELLYTNKLDGTALQGAEQLRACIEQEMSRPLVVSHSKIELTDSGDESEGN